MTPAKQKKHLGWQGHQTNLEEKKAKRGKLPARVPGPRKTSPLRKIGFVVYNWRSFFRHDFQVLQGVVGRVRLSVLGRFACAEADSHR